MILNTQNQGFAACGCRQDVFSSFFSLYKPMTPRLGQYWPKGHNLNLLGRDLLDNASNLR